MGLTLVAVTAGWLAVAASSPVAAAASTPQAGTVRLSMRSGAPSGLVTARGTYTDGPVWLDVYIHATARGTHTCPATNQLENAQVEREIRQDGTGAAAVLMYTSVGQLSASGGFEQQAYFGVDSPAGAYLACAYLLGGNGDSTLLARASLAFTVGTAGVTVVPGGQPKVDPCIVGTWRELGEQDTVSLNGASGTVRGDRGRLLEFSARGTETVSYAQAADIKGLVGREEYVVAERGYIVFSFSASRGTLAFYSADYSHLKSSATWGARRLELRYSGPPAPDRYSCTRTSLTQSARGYHATFART